MNFKKCSYFFSQHESNLVTSHEYRTILLERPCVKIRILVTLSYTCTHEGAQRLLRVLCFTAMPSARDQKRRELVKVLKELLHAYGVQFHITRDTPDDAIKRAFKRLSLKVHPDRRGKTEDQQRLNDACRAWNDA